MEMVCCTPELVLFFDLYDSLKQMSPIKKDAEPNVITRKTIEIQTDTHPIPYKKDKNYSWNLWDARRHTIKMANLQQCTRSTQTNIGYSNRYAFAFGTQTDH